MPSDPKCACCSNPLLTAVRRRHSTFAFVSVYCGLYSWTYKLEYEVWLSNSTDYRSTGYPCARIMCTGSVRPIVQCDSSECGLGVLGWRRP